MPIGHRLAFDADRGRLWVVCRKCERWNLTPFEERWEAIEQCERAFRETRVRVSTDHIGLARLKDGTDLVRIGNPLRPEFAAWRYGDQFGRRRRKRLWIGAGSAVAAGAIVAGAVGSGVGLFGLVQFAPALSNIIMSRYYVQTRTRIHLPSGEYLRLAGRVLLINSSERGWGLDIGYGERLNEDKDTRLARRLGKLVTTNDMEIGRMRVFGDDAQAVLRRIMPMLNRGGGTRRQISESVKLIEEVGDPAMFTSWASKQMRAWAARSVFGDTGGFETMPAAARLALEMAINEENERRALQGELALLEQVWREAEEVASIADSLTIPMSITAKLQQLKLR